MKYAISLVELEVARSKASDEIACCLHPLGSDSPCLGAWQLGSSISCADTSTKVITALRVSRCRQCSYRLRTSAWLESIPSLLCPHNPPGDPAIFTHLGGEFGEAWQLILDAVDERKL